VMCSGSVMTVQTTSIGASMRFHALSGRQACPSSIDCNLWLRMLSIIERQRWLLVESLSVIAPSSVPAELFSYSLRLQQLGGNRRGAMTGQRLNEQPRLPFYD